MTNWLADPVACAVRLKNESGCAILAGRNEVMSRTTLVHRQETQKGSRYEWGHMAVEVDGKPGETRRFRATSTEVTGNSSMTTGTGWLSSEHANVMSDLLRAAHVNAGGSNCGGKTLYEMIWDEMLVVTDRLIGIADAGAEPDPDDVGAARSLAWVIAVMQNPYLPNVDSVREQTMQRWEEMDRTPPPSASAAKATPAARRAARRARRA